MSKFLNIVLGGLFLLGCNTTCPKVNWDSENGERCATATEAEMLKVCPDGNIQRNRFTGVISCSGSNAQLEEERKAKEEAEKKEEELRQKCSEQFQHYSNVIKKAQELKENLHEEKFVEWMNKHFSVNKSTSKGYGYSLTNYTWKRKSDDPCTSHIYVDVTFNNGIVYSFYNGLDQ